MGQKAKANIVTQNDTFSVDNREFEVIKDFINFVRGRERGEFYAEIVTHQTNTKEERWIKLKFTDQTRFKLDPINK